MLYTDFTHCRLINVGSLTGSASLGLVLLFHRFVSAFSDKMLGSFKKNSLFSVVRSEVREDFARFAKYVLDRSDNHFELNRQVAKYQSHCQESVVQRLIQPTRHWRPMYVNCGYCFLRHDLVGRVESMGDGLAAMLDLAGATEEDRERVNLDTRKNTTPLRDNKTMSYFGQLHPEMRRRLYELYSIDFNMFGYSPDEFL